MLIAPELDTDALLTAALLSCASKLGQNVVQLRAQLGNGSPAAHSTLRYVIAKKVARYLGKLQCGIRGVYLYGSTMNDEAGLGSDIDLLVLVERKRDQARILLLQLDLALLTSYRTLIGEGYSPATLLDVHFVDGEEEKAHRGYGAVLHSLHTSPVSLWWRDPT